MWYEQNLKQTILDILAIRMSSIADSIVVLTEQGYIPNKNKYSILAWSNILAHAYNNITRFDKEQQNKLDSLYNQVLKL